MYVFQRVQKEEVKPRHSLLHSIDLLKSEDSTSSLVGSETEQTDSVTSLTATPPLVHSSKDVDGK